MNIFRSTSTAVLLVAFLAISVSSVTKQAYAQQTIIPPDEETTTEPILPPEQGPIVLENKETLDRLFAQLKKDTKETSSTATAQMIWREWTASGSISIDLLMGWAGNAMRREDYAKAVDMLDQVTVLAPEFAEGWNRRATVYYKKSDFSRSLADIEKTLALEPRHFGALSGLAVIMQRLNRDKDALKAWYKVLEIYPANKAAQDAVIALEEKLAGSRT